MSTPEELIELAKLKEWMFTQGDGKWYFPCCECKGFNGRRLKLQILEKHCRDYGHVEGGYEYHPMVSYLLYVFVYIDCVYNVFFHFNIYYILYFYLIARIIYKEKSS